MSYLDTLKIDNVNPLELAELVLSAECNSREKILATAILEMASQIEALEGDLRAADHPHP